MQIERALPYLSKPKDKQNAFFEPLAYNNNNIKTSYNKNQQLIIMSTTLCYQQTILRLLSSIYSLSPSSCLLALRLLFLNPDSMHPSGFQKPSSATHCEFFYLGHEKLSIFVCFLILQCNTKSHKIPENHRL